MGDQPAQRGLARSAECHYTVSGMGRGQSQFRCSHASGARKGWGGLADIWWVIIVSLALSAATARGASTKVDLLLSAETAKPGDTVTAGIRLRMASGWHTYWRYPGDAGIATSAKWSLPPGVTAEPIEWPVPEKLVEPPLTGYIYNGEVVLLVPLRIVADASPGTYDLNAKVKWQECEKECLLGEADVTARLSVGTETRASSDAAVIEAARARLPKREPGFTAEGHWEKDAEARPLIIEWVATNKPAEIDFFPYKNTNYNVKGDLDKLPSAVERRGSARLWRKRATRGRAGLTGCW